MGVDLAKAKAQLEDALKRDAERGNKTNFFPVEKGENKGRLLPPVNDLDTAWVQAGRHFKIAEGKALLCPKVTYNKPCPICEYVSMLFTSKDKSAWNEANEKKAKVRFISNALTIDKDGHHDGNVYFFEFGPQIRNQFLAYFADAEYGDFTDPIKGLNFKLTKNGEKMTTTYTVTLSRLQSVIENWEDVKSKMINLSEYTAKELLPYEVLNGLLHGTLKIEDVRGGEKTETSPPPTASATKKDEEKKSSLSETLERLRKAAAK